MIRHIQSVVDEVAQTVSIRLEEVFHLPIEGHSILVHVDAHFPFRHFTPKQHGPPTHPRSRSPLGRIRSKPHKDCSMCAELGAPNIWWNEPAAAGELTHVHQASLSILQVNCNVRRITSPSVQSRIWIKVVTYITLKDGVQRREMIVTSTYIRCQGSWQRCWWRNQILLPKIEQREKINPSPYQQEYSLLWWYNAQVWSHWAPVLRNRQLWTRSSSESICSNVACRKIIQVTLFSMLSSSLLKHILQGLLSF